MTVTAAPAPTPVRSGRFMLPTFSKPLGMVFLALVVCILPWLGIDDYWVAQLEQIAILALIVSGLNISLGYAGELAVAQIALYCTGAYVAGYLAVSHGVSDITLCMVAAIAAVILVGLVTGIPGLRLGGWSLAMVSFFLVLLIPNILNLLKTWTGGLLGLSGIPVPTFFGITLTTHWFYLYVMVVTALWFALMRNLVRSTYGNAFLVLKQSPILAASLGISVFRLKLLAYVIGAVPCGIAGVLFAFKAGYLAPEDFTFSLAISVLAASVVGGSQSVYGAIFGAALLVEVPERVSGFQNWSLIVYGAFLIAAGLLFSQGVAGLVRQATGFARRQHWLPPPIVAPEHHAEPAADDVVTLPDLHGEVLSVQGARKLFGGNVAVDDVSIEARPGEVTALIGPNGSGKTTLLNLICGYYKLNAGDIRLGDTVLSGRSTYQTARAGVARTFQTPLIPQGMSTRDFVVTGRFISNRIRLAAAAARLPSFWRKTRGNDLEAIRLLQLLGLQDAADQAVSSLPLGTRRLAEVARVLAAEPKLFLFDEVGSGLDEGDIARLEEAIGMIRRAGGTIVLVEHNFPLVLRVADRIHVLSNGALLASGTPEEIQNDPRVLEEYTGVVDEEETIAELEGLTPDEGGEPAGAPR